MKSNRILSVILFTLMTFSMFTACTHEERPLSAAELLNLGERYLLELNYEQALVHFTRLIEVEPMNLRGHLGAAEAHVGLGDIESAVEILRHGLAQIPRNAELQEALDALLSELETMTLYDYVGASSNGDGGVLNSEDDSAVVNLTGQPPLTRGELEEMGLSVHLQDLVGRYGISQEEVDSFFSPDYRPGAWGTLGDITVYMINSVRGTNIDVNPSTGIVHSMSFFVSDDSSELSFRDSILRFEFGMTLLEVLNTLAVSNPDLFSAAENPTRENLLAYSTPFSSPNVIAQIADARIENEDGEFQAAHINIYTEEVEAQNSQLYSLVIFLSQNITVQVHFNANGEMDTVWMNFFGNDPNHGG